MDSQLLKYLNLHKIRSLVEICKVKKVWRNLGLENQSALTILLVLMLIQLNQIYLLENLLISLISLKKGLKNNKCQIT